MDFHSVLFILNNYFTIKITQIPQAKYFNLLIPPTHPKKTVKWKSMWYIIRKINITLPKLLKIEVTYIRNNLTGENRATFMYFKSFLFADVFTLYMIYPVHGDIERLFVIQTVPANWSNLTVSTNEILDPPHVFSESYILKSKHVIHKPVCSQSVPVHHGFCGTEVTLLSHGR